MKFAHQNSQSESGFALLESLVSLSVLTIVLVLMLPLAVDLLAFREIQKEDLEGKRVVYDAAREWNGKEEKTQWKSGIEEYAIHYTKSGLTVIGKEDKTYALEITAIDFKSE